jgi:hypothetical protein
MNTHALNASCTGFDTVSQESGQTCTAFRPYPELLSIEHFVWGCYTSPGSTLIATRNILLEIGGYDVQFARYEDWDLLLRLAGASPEGVGFIDDALATIHVERKISSDAWLSALDMLLEKHGESIKNQHKALLRKFRSGIHFNRASAFASRRAWRAMFTELAKSMTIMPIGNWPVRVILAERLRTTS